MNRFTRLLILKKMSYVWSWISLHFYMTRWCSPFTLMWCVKRCSLTRVRYPKRISSTGRTLSLQYAKIDSSSEVQHQGAACSCAKSSWTISYDLMRAFLRGVPTQAWHLYTTYLDELFALLPFVRLTMSDVLCATVPSPDPPQYHRPQTQHERALCGARMRWPSLSQHLMWHDGCEHPALGYFETSKKKPIDLFWNT